MKRWAPRLPSPSLILLHDTFLSFFSCPPDLFWRSLIVGTLPGLLICLERVLLRITISITICDFCSLVSELSRQLRISLPNVSPHYSGGFPRRESKVPVHTDTWPDFFSTIGIFCAEGLVRSQKCFRTSSIIFLACQYCLCPTNCWTTKQSSGSGKVRPTYWCNSFCKKIKMFRR